VLLPGRNNFCWDVSSLPCPREGYGR
jgi:hypothetical protein